MKSVWFAVAMLVFATPVLAEEVCQNDDCHLEYESKSQVGSSVTIANPRLSVPGHGKNVIYTSRNGVTYFGMGLCRALGFTGGVASETAALELNQPMAVYNAEGNFIGLFPASVGNLAIITLICEE